MGSSLPLRSRVARPLTAAVLVLAAATGLTACSGSPIDNIVGGTVDRAIDEAFGGEVDLSTDGRIPSGFPEADVPLVEGTVVGGGSAGGAGWVVVLNPESIERFDDAQRALEDAGFTADTVNRDGDSAFGSFSGPGYSVQLTFGTDTSGVVTATYVVTPA